MQPSKKGDIVLAPGSQQYVVISKAVTPEGVTNVRCVSIEKLDRERNRKLVQIFREEELIVMGNKYDKA